MANLIAPFAASTISSPYNPKRTYKNAKGQTITSPHLAVDYAARNGVDVPAAGDGTVVEVSHSSVRGYMVAVDHGDGIGTRYHMLANAGRPRAGAKIKQGQAVGKVAAKAEWGSSSSGDHVHVEVRINGAIRGETTAAANTPNPINYFNALDPAGTGAKPLLGLDDDMPVLIEDIDTYKIYWTDGATVFTETTHINEVWSLGLISGQFRNTGVPADDGKIRDHLRSLGMSHATWVINRIRAEVNRNIAVRTKESDTAAGNVAKVVTTEGKKTTDAIAKIKLPEIDASKIKLDTATLVKDIVAGISTWFKRP